MGQDQWWARSTMVRLVTVSWTCTDLFLVNSVGTHSRSSAIVMTKSEIEDDWWVYNNGRLLRPEPRQALGSAWMLWTPEKKDSLSKCCFESALSRLIGAAAVCEVQVEFARQGKSRQHQVFFRSPSSFSGCSEAVVVFLWSVGLATGLERLIRHCIDSLMRKMSCGWSIIARQSIA